MVPVALWLSKHLFKKISQGQVRLVDCVLRAGSSIAFLLFTRKKLPGQTSLSLSESSRSSRLDWQSQDHSGRICPAGPHGVVVVVCCCWLGSGENTLKKFSPVLKTIEPCPERKLRSSYNGAADASQSGSLQKTGTTPAFYFSFKYHG